MGMGWIYDLSRLHDEMVQAREKPQVSFTQYSTVQRSCELEESAHVRDTHRLTLLSLDAELNLSAVLLLFPPL